MERFELVILWSRQIENHKQTSDSNFFLRFVGKPLRTEYGLTFEQIR